MSSHRVDVRSVKVPERLVHALVALAMRLFEKTREECNLLLGAVLGKEPSFGNFALVAASDVELKAEQAGIHGLSAVAVRELVNLFGRVNERTTVCFNCGDMGLAANGGTVQEYPSGTACSFCRAGTFEIVPITLRRLHWVTGALTDAGVGEDVTTFPATFVPHDDASIKRWVGNVHHTLVDACAQTGIPLYSLLAVMNLRRHEFRNTGREGKVFLQDPQEFGIEGDALKVLIQEAERFLDEREITNLPERKFLSNGMLRSDYWPLKIGSRTYLVEGLIGQGDKCDVYRGWWSHTPTEQVVIKVLVNRSDKDLLDAEIAHVCVLSKSNERGSEYFKGTVPMLVTSGLAVFPDGTIREAVVYRYQHGRDWNLREVMDAYTYGVSTKTMVWMANRLFLQMSWWHDTGLVHGGLIPSHLLIHPRDHLMDVVDWTTAVRNGHMLRYGVKGHQTYYPFEVFNSKPLSIQTDIAMACRVMIAVVGGNPETGEVPAKVPKSLADMLITHARYGTDEQSHRLITAMKFYTEFGAVAKREYGPRSYTPFHMPPTAEQVMEAGRN